MKYELCWLYNVLRSVVMVMMMVLLLLLSADEYRIVF